MAVHWRVVVTLQPGGETYRLARENYAIADAAQGGRELLVRGALSQVSIPMLGSDSSSDAELEADDAVVPVNQLVAKGVVLSGCPAEVALWRRGSDWSARRILLSGRVKPDGVARNPYQSKVRLTLTDYGEQYDLPFPRWAIDARGFPEADAGMLGQTMQVLYGDLVDVPLLQVRPSQPGVTGSGARYIVAGHRILSPRILVRPDGDAARAFALPIAYETDPASGATYAYVAPTDDQLAGSSSLVADLQGYASPGGGLICGLGDLVEHVIGTHTRVPPERVDSARLTRFRAHANRLVMASMFGGSAQGDTAIATLKSRYEGSLPVIVSWRGGLIGADYTGWDSFAVPVRSFTYERELLQRLGDADLVCEGPPYTDYTVSYGVHAYGQSARSKPTPRAYVYRSRKTGDARCVAAATRYGDVVMPPVQLVDVRDAGGAASVIDALVDRYSVVRTRVRYLARIDDVVDLPLLERYDLTDAPLGLAGEPFRLEEVQHREDDLAELTFVSYRPLPV